MSNSNGDTNQVAEEPKSSELVANKQVNEVKSEEVTEKSSVKDESSATSAEKTNKNQSTTKAKRKSGQKSRSSRRFPWAASIVLLVILALGAGNYWQYQQGLTLKQSQQQFGQQLEAAVTQIADLNSRLLDAGNKQATLALQAQEQGDAQENILASLDQMSQQMKALAATKGKDPLYWRVSEVEYLLSVANHRLQLEKDPSTALAALQDADKRLHSIADPGLIPVRKKVATEINSLKQVSLPDIPGMATQLTSVASSIEKIPFVKSAHNLESIQKGSTDGVGEAEPGIVDDATGFIAKVITDITNGLFTIQRTDEPIEPLLPPQEKHYLKQNLNLKVEQARIALLNQEADLFQNNLLAIEQWTQKYFDNQDPSVNSLLQTVAELKKIQLQPALPDISTSLRELRSWMAQQKQASIGEKTPGFARLNKAQLAELRREGGKP